MVKRTSVMRSTGRSNAANSHDTLVRAVEEDDALRIIIVTRRGGLVSTTCVSRAGRSGNLNLAGVNRA